MQEVVDAHQLPGAKAAAEPELVWTGPVLEGSDEAKQVDLFLEREQEVMKHALDGHEESSNPSPLPPQVEVEIED